MNLGNDTIFDKEPCTIYDVEKKLKIKDCESLSECALFLGLKTSNVHDIIRLKSRNKTNKLNLTITIRFKNKLK